MSKTKYLLAFLVIVLPYLVNCQDGKMGKLLKTSDFIIGSEFIGSDFKSDRLYFAVDFPIDSSFYFEPAFFSFAYYTLNSDKITVSWNLLIPAVGFLLSQFDQFGPPILTIAILVLMNPRIGIRSSIFNYSISLRNDLFFSNEPNKNPVYSEIMSSIEFYNQYKFTFTIDAHFPFKENRLISSDPFIQLGIRYRIER